jgi:outer membrane protein OmpA-like peptidoglycan-associated protein
MFEQRACAGRDASVTRCLALALCAAVSGCGGTMQFSDTSSLVVVGEPPKPPEPEPPPPPKPKRVEVTQDKIDIKEKIQFDFNKATIKPESHGLLDEIVEVVRDNPHIRKLSIEGHTDSDGSDSYNLKLSDDRAKSVLAYLTEHGIEAKRLTAKGFGETKPIGDNADEAGKEQNRRVEFLITEQDEITKTYEEDPETGERKEVKAKKKKKKEEP